MSNKPQFVEKQCIGEICSVEKKSKIKASFGIASGPYRFFTSSPVQTKYYDEALFVGPALIFGTGGTASVHYCEEPFATSTDCLVYKTKENDISLEAIYRYLKANMRLLEAGFKGAGLKHISRKYIDKIDVPAIGQKPFAKDRLPFILIEATISNRIAARAKLDQLVKSQFVEMFGDPADTGDKRALVSIGSFTDVQTGATPLRKEPKYYGGFIPWVKTGEVARNFANGVEENITDIAIKETNCKIFPAGTVLVAMYGQGDTRGKAAILPFEAATNQACAAIMPSSSHDEVFLNAQLQLLYEDMRAKSLGGNQKNLSLGIIKSMKVLLPSIEMQQEFAAFAAQVDKSRSIAQQQIEKLQTLYDSLAQDYFGD